MNRSLERMLLKIGEVVRRYSPLEVMAAVALLAIVMMALPAYPQTPKMCIAAAGSVPGQPGAPDWWTTGQNPNTRAYQPDDPRWLGAMSLDYGTGTTSEAEFRALRQQQGTTTYLLLSWFIKSVPSVVPDSTSLFVGFAPNQTNPSGTIIRVRLKQDSTGTNDSWQPKPKDDGATPYYDVSIYTGSGTTSWTASGASPPAWLTGTTRVWMNSMPSSVKNRWVVQMRVPLDSTGVNGINVGNPNSFRMWHYAQLEYVYNPSMPPAIIPYTWPRTDSAATGPAAYAYVYRRPGGVDTFPHPDTWAEFSTQSPSVAGCSGITIASSDIGTTHATYQSYISLTGPNSFFARPSNSSTAAVNPNTLSATFRFANWGSQVGDVTSASWQSPTSLTGVADTGGIAGHSGPPGGPYPKGNITGQWNLTPGVGSLSDRCPFIGRSGVTDRNGQFIAGDPACPNASPTRMLHACMLVELNGPGLNFLTKSAFRNMDFVSASQFERDAEVSVVGLPALAGGKRDVYLYLERLNMPRFDPRGEKKPVPTGQQKEMLAMLARGKPVDMSYDRTAQIMPTYILHAYFDTGVQVPVDGKTQPIFLPQTSFGYFVAHEGKLEGWTDKLEGAEQIGPNHYRVPVANNSAAQIKTKITAVEEPCPTGIGGICKSFGRSECSFLALGLIGVGFTRRRRKNESTPSS